LIVVWPFLLLDKLYIKPRFYDEYFSFFYTVKVYMALSELIIIGALLLIVAGDKIGLPQVDPQIKVVIVIWLVGMMLLKRGHRRHQIMDANHAPYKVPKPYANDNQREDYYASGLQHNFGETYYDVGVDRVGAENAEKLAEMIDQSKLKTILSQQNVVVPRSPHCHVGKDRGYLNWN